MDQERMSLLLDAPSPVALVSIITDVHAASGRAPSARVAFEQDKQAPRE